MDVFDQAARSATEVEPHAIIARLMSIAQLSLRFDSWGDTRITVHPEERDQTADRLAVLSDSAAPDRPWLGLLEFQAEHDPDKLDDTFAEVAQLRRTKRHGAERRGKYNVLAALIYLQGHCPDPVLDMTTPAGVGTRHAPVIWNVCDDSASQTLDDFEAGRITWGIMFFVSLMQGAAELPVIARWRDLLARVPSDRDRANAVRVALIFAGLAGRGQEWLRVLEDWDMTESTILNQWLDQERLKTTREKVVRLLHRRFPGKVQQDVVETINSQPSLVLLDQWFDEAATAATIEDFVTVLRR